MNQSVNYAIEKISQLFKLIAIEKKKIHNDNDI